MARKVVKGKKKKKRKKNLIKLSTKIGKRKEGGPTTLKKKKGIEHLMLKEKI